MPTKEVNVFDLQLIEYKYPHLTLRITCSTGTYIRSLARDIGQALGTGAYVKQLDRIRVGPHKIENSVKLHILTKDYILRHLLPTAELVSHLPTIVLPDDNVAQFYKGQKIEGREVEKQLSSALNNNKITRKLTINKHNGFVAIFNDTSTLLGIGYYDSITHLLHPKKVIPLPSPFI